MPSKYVGSRTYVESGSHAKSSPSGTGSERQVSSPVKTSAYVARNISSPIALATVSCTSSGEGQMSERKTSSPSEPTPIGSRREVDVHPPGERVRDDERR